MSAENGLRPEVAVEHHFHGRGIINSLSPCGQYAVVRYPSGYMRTHRLRDLTRVIPPSSDGGAA